MGLRLANPKPKSLFTVDFGRSESAFRPFVFELIQNLQSHRQGGNVLSSPETAPPERLLAEEFSVFFNTPGNFSELFGFYTDKPLGVFTIRSPRETLGIVG